VLTAPGIPALVRALDLTASALDRLTRIAAFHPIVSVTATLATAFALALVGLGAVASFLRDTILKSAKEGLGVLRWLVTTGAPLIVSWLTRPFWTIVRSAVALGDLLLAWYMVIAAIATLALAGYELYRHWDAVKRRLSRWSEATHKAIARLMKRMADKIGNAAAYASHSIAGLTATLSSAPNSLATVTATTRSTNHARSLEHARAVARPAPMLHAVGRAAAAAAFAAPLMLAGASAGALAAPPISPNDAARIAAPLSAVSMAQTPIVISYAPNVVIHSQDAADAAHLKQRVMEVLERHGRELHHTLQREMLRQQRRDF
jgi:hypothetical protein